MRNSVLLVAAALATLIAAPVMAADFTLTCNKGAELRYDLAQLSAGTVSFQSPPTLVGAWCDNSGLVKHVLNGTSWGGSWHMPDATFESAQAMDDFLSNIELIAQAKNAKTASFVGGDQGSQTGTPLGDRLSRPVLPQ